METRLRYTADFTTRGVKGVHIAFWALYCTVLLARRAHILRDESSVVESHTIIFIYVSPVVVGKFSLPPFDHHT